MAVQQEISNGRRITKEVIYFGFISQKSKKNVANKWITRTHITLKKTCIEEVFISSTQSRPWNRFIYHLHFMCSIRILIEMLKLLDFHHAQVSSLFQRCVFLPDSRRSRFEIEWNFPAPWWRIRPSDCHSFRVDIARKSWRPRPRGCRIYNQSWAVAEPHFRFVLLWESFHSLDYTTLDMIIRCYGVSCKNFWFKQTQIWLE